MSQTCQTCCYVLVETPIFGKVKSDMATLKNSKRILDLTLKFKILAVLKVLKVLENKFSLLWGEAQLYFALCLPKEKEINRNVLKIIYYRKIHQQIYNKVSNYIMNFMNLKLITYS